MNKKTEVEKDTGCEAGEHAVPAEMFLDQPLYPNAAQVMALMFTKDYVTRHLSGRRFKGDGTPAHTATFLGLGRYQALLDAGMRDLDGQFTEAEWLTLQNVFPGHVFDPPEIATLAGEFYDYFGWESNEDIPEDLRGLATKLSRLGQLQRFALADAIERFWQSAIRNSDKRLSMSDAADEIGLKLRVE